MASEVVNENTYPTLKNLTSPDYGKFSKEQLQEIQELVRPHIDSFNFMLEEGLSLAAQDIHPQEFSLTDGQRISLYFTDASIGIPVVADNNLHATQMNVFPSECRECATTYKAKLQVMLHWKVDNQPQGSLTKVIANVPIMVKSSHCSLANLGPEELVRHHEEAEEAGGYFIVNGLEKVLRMLILPRRNYPLAVVRPSWRKRGPLYTEFGIQMRCVQKDQTGVNSILHYLSDGSIIQCIIFRKELFYVPVVFILKALVNTTDQHIYRELIKGEEDNTFLKDCVATMLRAAQGEGVTTQKSILKYIGERFRVKLALPEWYIDEAIAEFLIRHCVCIHLESPVDKFNFLIFSTRKLYALAAGKCAGESPDNPMNQEILLGGHLYLMVLKEKLESWLLTVRFNIQKEIKNKSGRFVFNQQSLMTAISKGSNISNQMEHFLSTGNLVTKTGLGLQQVNGFAVVADRLNYWRFLSHFRCVHRGSFFAQMRTTTVRKLLPEAWGFLCPVHTPDGAPCGLLNHMTASCQVVNVISPVGHLPRLLCTMGMTPLDAPPPANSKDCYTVVLNGQVVGQVDKELAKPLADRLRVLKVMREEKVPQHMEICLVPITDVPSQYPGLFLFTTPARMVRPVYNLAATRQELIGSFEQVYMDIAVIKDEIHSDTTHVEIKPTSMLSTLANLTPFSDFNQSPRNMYQCQMGKQTMGTPAHAIRHRNDTKLYRIQTPQSPIVRPSAHDVYVMDNYPHGTNAVVAVISYTGYDMEDAMILNKGSFERGFGHGTVYKTEVIKLENIDSSQVKKSLLFGCPGDDERTEGMLDADGLPFIGRRLKTGEPLYCYIDTNTGESKVKNYKSLEEAVVDDVKILGREDGSGALNKVAIKYRIQRNPIIGDKFSSRHGQKGICSQKWPVENMPFSESGMTPDILFNPHGFPSRMTIGMMVESMAGKSAALNGHVYDATPFTFSEDNSAVEYFGELLRQSGYNYFGTERMYSGIDGREFEADIFMGVVYYQRLRHMVADKYQVRTTGPIDILTHQPVQGRKRQGGIRFGEMERDALLAHGTSFLLQDRLMNCSDKSMGYVCAKCGSLLSPLLEKPAKEVAAASANTERKWRCRKCQTSEYVQMIAFPYVFRYLVAELAAVNIKISLDIKKIGE